MKNDKNNKIIMWMLGICLAISLVFIGQKLKEKKEYAESQLESANTDYYSLNSEYHDLKENHSLLIHRFDELNKKYMKLKKKTAKPKAVSAKAKSSSSSSSSSSNSSSDDDSSTSSDVIVHITDYGSKYHAAGCRYLKKSDITISKSEAEQRGLSPCSVCNP